MPTRHDIDHMDKHMAALFADYDGVEVDVSQAATLVRRLLVSSPIDRDDILAHIEARANNTKLNDPNSRQRVLGAELEIKTATIRARAEITSPYDAMRAIYEGQEF